MPNSLKQYLNKFHGLDFKIMPIIVMPSMQNEQQIKLYLNCGSEGCVL